MREDSQACTFDLHSSYVDLAAEVFSLLSDPTRIRIILALRGGELPVGELAERVGKSRLRYPSIWRSCAGARSCRPGRRGPACTTA